MSLLRLLTAGKSLVGLKDSANRYRPVAKRSMPTFPSKAHPFRTTAKPELATGVAPTAAQPQGGECQPEQPKRESVTARLGAFFGGRNKSEKAPARQPEAPVQAELSLDDVKVVRNDLSDADLEVVVGGKKPSTAEPATAWSKIAGKLVSAK
jgi:hypothetical protein